MKYERGFLLWIFNLVHLLYGIAGKAMDTLPLSRTKW